MGKRDEQLPREHRTNFTVERGVGELVFGTAPEGMCAYETGLKHRHHRVNSHGQTAWELPVSPGAAEPMHKFGDELPQWGGSGLKDFDGCWRDTEGRFLLMEAKSQFVGESGARHLSSLIKKLELWVGNVHRQPKEQSNRWTWDRMTYKGTPKSDQARWMTLPVVPSRLVVVVPAVDERAWKKLRAWVRDHREHFGAAELWRLHAPVAVPAIGQRRSSAVVHNLLD